ncbi:MAG: tRNA (adenosine(37)-N6)-threonylcarbamoyltransferase complex dimerization subunit type 1 TsaB [Chloroflexi bacterium]|nr:tRNA (adenosine(37)-N6)-threonylcarbamoyltransferase complex dimerization subunit type 1 TsaB [Chloroflexota bacterium]
MYLAIDTSTSTAGVALLAEDGAIRSELTWVAGRNHTVELFGAIEQVLGQGKGPLSELRGVVVARGPGSFTGIRVGMSAAKGLAAGLGLPIVGVSTLEAEAIPYAWSGLPIWAVLDAGRGELAAALFQDAGSAWSKLEEEQILSTERLCQKVEQHSVFCGEMPPVAEAYIRERLRDQAVFPAGPARLRRAGYIGYLGWMRLSHGQSDDPVTLAPLYLRHPAVLEKEGGAL